MSSDPSVWASAVPIVGATISMGGALYVGWRQRKLTRALAERQNELADEVLRRQLCVTLASRALIVAERANEVVRLTNAFTRTRLEDVATHTGRLDNASDNFLEAWAELASWGMATPELATCVDELTDALEATRLRVLLDAARESTASLSVVETKARECRELAVALVPRGESGGRIRSLPSGNT